MFVALVLPACPPPEARSEVKREWHGLSLLREARELRPLFLVSAVAWFALATLEGTFGRLIKYNLGFGPREFGLLFGYESALAYVVQGLAIAWIDR